MDCAWASEDEPFVLSTLGSAASLPRPAKLAHDALLAEEARAAACSSHFQGMDCNQQGLWCCAAWCCSASASCTCPYQARPTAVGNHPISASARPAGHGILCATPRTRPCIWPWPWPWQGSIGSPLPAAQSGRHGSVLDMCACIDI